MGLTEKRSGYSDGMPELPDVEVYRREFARTGLHREVAGVHTPDVTMLTGVSRRRLREDLEGAELTTTRRHGKHLFARIGSSRWLMLHFGMTGRLEHVRPEGTLPAHARFTLAFDDGWALVLDDQRRLGRVSIVDDPDEYVATFGLGEDALRIDRQTFRNLLCGRRGGLKSALMDQSVIAGIGNVYSDEILFQSRLHPRSRPPDLDSAGYDRLHRRLRRVLTMAADRNADPASVPRTWLLPHRTNGERCPRRNGHIEKHHIVGRGAYLCPVCQSAG